MYPAEGWGASRLDPPDVFFVTMPYFTKISNMVY